MIKRILRTIVWTIRFIAGWIFYVMGAPFMLIGKPLWWMAARCFGVPPKV